MAGLTCSITYFGVWRQRLTCVLRSSDLNVCEFTIALAQSKFDRRRRSGGKVLRHYLSTNMTWYRLSRTRLLYLTQYTGRWTETLSHTCSLPSRKAQTRIMTYINKKYVLWNVHLPNALHSVCLNSLSCTEVGIYNNANSPDGFPITAVVYFVHQGPNVYCF